MQSFPRFINDHSNRHFASFQRIALGVRAREYNNLLVVVMVAPAAATSPFLARAPTSTPGVVNWQTGFFTRRRSKLQRPCTVTTTTMGTTTCCYTEKAPNAWQRRGTQKTRNTYNQPNRPNDTVVYPKKAPYLITLEDVHHSHVEIQLTRFLDRCTSAKTVARHAGDAFWNI